jgi:isopenicillin N synthase-like dioxygenase
MVPLHEQRASQIEKFSRSCHSLCLDLLSIFALALDFPTERYFDASHDYNQKGGDHIRLLRYPPMSTLNDLPLSWDNIRTRILAHSDFGSLTLLFNQHVAGLQILDPRTNSWKYAAPRADGGIIVNVGDALQAFSAGVLKSSWHRVVAPPRELGQEGETRYSLVYLWVPSRPSGCWIALTYMIARFWTFEPTAPAP